MHLTFDIEHWLIFVTMALCLLAGVLLLGKNRKAGYVVYAAGFVIAIAAMVHRGISVGHLPLQNLYEVFLSLGVAPLPISAFCRRFLKVGGETADAFIGAVVLFPAAFVFNSRPQHLPPALQSWLFGPHVAAYMLSYMIMVKAAVQAVAQLASREQDESEGPATAPTGISYQEATYRVVSLGFPLLTVGLALGCWWGKVAWGDFWNWDPKELWSLTSWLIYVGYLHVHYMSGARRPRLGSALALAGAAAIVITLLWVNLANIFKGMHSYAS